MDKKYYELINQRGVIETLQVLMELPNYEVVQKIFYLKLKEAGSYNNAYLRVKEKLMSYGLISFKLNQNYERVIRLTEKGQKLQQKIYEIEQRLDQNCMNFRYNILYFYNK